MNVAASAELDQWRERLQALGFDDDGHRLCGPIQWEHPDRGAVSARIEVVPDKRFPFAPPQVRILETSTPLKFTFHIERAEKPGGNGHLCLWGDDWDVAVAPWRDPQRLLHRVAGWLESTAHGWPDDNACDLERYLPPDRGPLVLYDSDELQSLKHVPVRVRDGQSTATVRVTAEVRAGSMSDSRRRLARKDRHLAWVEDLGSLEQPVRSWADLENRLGTRAANIAAGISAGLIERLVLRYRRGIQSSVLVVRARTSPAGGIAITACESADVSGATRRMRAGRQARALGDTKVAIVGCGAIGSFAADLLFRSGVHRLTLIDGEVLRPGNVVRHLAGRDQVGLPKVKAVRACLDAIDDTTKVRATSGSVRSLSDAIKLVCEHDVVVDATASARASSVFATAAEIIGGVVVSVCVQREGDVVRVDRFPADEGETYLPGLELIDDGDLPWERGCGSPVSLTPPGAVVAAAELACRVVIDEALSNRTYPASLAEVRRSQPEAPFDQVGWVEGQAEHQTVWAPPAKDHEGGNSSAITPQQLLT